MPAEFVEDTVELGDQIATCTGCGEPILSGGGITVTTDGDRYHPACRATGPAKPRRKAAA